MSDFVVEVSTRLTMYSNSEVTVRVKLDDKTLTKEISGLFLNYRIKKTVKKFKETLKAVSED